MAVKMEEEIMEEPGFPTGTILTIIGLILIIGVGSYFFIFRNRSRTPSPSEIARQIITPSPSRIVTPSNMPVVAPQAGGRQAEKVLEIHATNFSFSKPEIRVKNGDVVKILLVNDGGVHNIGIDEFNARTNTINQGQVSEVTFLADKTGIFEFYCSVNNHRAMGMVGKLVVE